MCSEFYYLYVFAGRTTATLQLFYFRRLSMNRDIIEGNWKQLKGSIKEQWGNLTDDQLDVIAGKRDKFAGKLQESYGITKNEADKQISAFQKRQRSL